MAAGIYNIVLNKNETFSRVFTWKSGGTEVNLTGYTAKLQVRRKTGDTVILTFTTADSSIVLGGTAGTITLALAAASTTSLSAITAKYDLILTSGSGTITRLLEGDFIIRSGITES